MTSRFEKIWSDEVLGTYSDSRFALYGWQKRIEPLLCDDKDHILMKKDKRNCGVSFLLVYYAMKSGVNVAIITQHHPQHLIEIARDIRRDTGLGYDNITFIPFKSLFRDLSGSSYIEVIILDDLDLRNRLPDELINISNTINAQMIIVSINSSLTETRYNMKGDPCEVDLVYALESMSHRRFTIHEDIYG